MLRDQVNLFGDQITTKLRCSLDHSDLDGDQAWGLPGSLGTKHRGSGIRAGSSPGSSQDAQGPFQDQAVFHVPTATRPWDAVGGMLSSNPRRLLPRAGNGCGGQKRGRAGRRDAGWGMRVPHGSEARRMARGVRGETGRGSCAGGKQQRAALRAAKEEEAAAAGAPSLHPAVPLSSIPHPSIHPSILLPLPMRSPP